MTQQDRSQRLGNAAVAGGALAGTGYLVHNAGAERLSSIGRPQITDQMRLARRSARENLSQAKTERRKQSLSSTRNARMEDPFRSPEQRASDAAARQQEKAAANRRVGARKAQVTHSQNVIRGQLKDHVLSVRSATRLKRAGLGAMGAGAVIAAGSAALAERSRRTRKAKPTPPAALKDYRSMMGTSTADGSIPTTHSGPNKEQWTKSRVSGRAASDWLKTHGGSA